MQQQQQEPGVAFRVLCPVDRIGAVTRVSVAGARIRFDSASASPFPSDRVVLISSTSAAQPALLAVFERIVLPFPQAQVEQQQQQLLNATCRLLSHSTQVGCILGTGGNTLERLRQDTGAQIRVFSKEHAFPDFNGTTDRLINISGTFNAVKKALISVSTLLLDNVKYGILTVRGPNSNNAAVMGPHIMGYNSTASSPMMFGSHLPTKSIGSSISGPDSRAAMTPPTCITTKVLIPSLYLPFVTGDDGTDLSHIKQMSGANLTVEDSKPGETTGEVIIYGTAEQTKTAQSLVHGLIFCGVFNSP